MKHYAIVTDVIRDEPFGVVVKEGTHNVCHGFHEAGYEWADLYNTGAVKALHDGLPPGVELGDFGPLPLDTEDLLSKSPQDIPTPKSFHLVESEWLENDSLGPAIKDVGLGQMPQESRQLAIDYKTHAFLVESSRSSMLLAVRLAGGGFTPDSTGFRSKTADRHEFSHLALGDSHTRRIAKDVLNSKMLILSQPYRFTDVPETDIVTKALGRKLGGNLARGGRRARRAAQMFDPNAIDADMDLLVQEGTPWERPVMRKPNLPSLPRTARSRAADRTPEARATAARTVRDRRGLRSARDLRGDMPDEGIDLSPAQERLIDRLRDDTFDTTLGDLYNDPTTPTSVTNAIENFTGLDKDDTDPIWDQKLSDISDTASANILDLMEADVHGDPEKYFGQRYTRGLGSITDRSNSHAVGGDDYKHPENLPGAGMVGPEFRKRLELLRDNGFHIYKSPTENTYKIIPPDRVRNAHRLQALLGRPNSNPTGLREAADRIAAKHGIRANQLDVGTAAHWEDLKQFADKDFLGVRQGRVDPRSMMSFHPNSSKKDLNKNNLNWLGQLVGMDPDSDERWGDDLLLGNLEDIARTGDGPLGYIPAERDRKAPRSADGEKIWSPVGATIGGSVTQREQAGEAARKMAIARAQQDVDARKELFLEASQNARKNPSPTTLAEKAQASRDLQEAEGDLVRLETVWTGPPGRRSVGPDPKDFDAFWNQAREESDNNIAGLLDSVSEELEQAKPDFEKIKTSHTEVLDAIENARKRGLRSVLRDGDDDYTPDPDRWHDDPFERDRAINSSIFGDRMDGMSIDDTAEKYGVNRHEVRSREIEHMEELAGQERYNAQPNLNQRIFDDRMNGMSLEDAAKKYDVDRIEIRAREITHSNALGGQERYNAQPNLNQRIYRDRMQGLSLDQVGRRYAMDRDEVRSREITHMGSDGRGLASEGPKPEVDAAKTAELNRRIDTLRKSKLQPWVDRVAEAKERGDDKSTRSLTKELRGFQEEEAELREQLGEAMGKGRVAIGLRSQRATEDWDADWATAREESITEMTELGEQLAGELKKSKTDRKKLNDLTDKISGSIEKARERGLASTGPGKPWQRPEPDSTNSFGIDGPPKDWARAKRAMDLHSNWEMHPPSDGPGYRPKSRHWGDDDVEIFGRLRTDNIDAEIIRGSETGEDGFVIVGMFRDLDSATNAADYFDSGVSSFRSTTAAQKWLDNFEKRLANDLDPWGDDEIPAVSLPDGLQPGDIVGQGAPWDGRRHLRELAEYRRGERGLASRTGNDEVDEILAQDRLNLDSRGDRVPGGGMPPPPDETGASPEFIQSRAGGEIPKLQAELVELRADLEHWNDLDRFGLAGKPEHRRGGNAHRQRSRALAHETEGALKPVDRRAIIAREKRWLESEIRKNESAIRGRGGTSGLASRRSGTSPDSREGGRAIERALGEARDMTVADLSDDNMLSRAGNEKLWRLLPDDMEEGHPDWDKPIRDLDLGEQVLGVIEEDFYDDPKRIFSRYEGAGPDTVEEARGLRSRGNDPSYEGPSPAEERGLDALMDRVDKTPIGELYDMDELSSQSNRLLDDLITEHGWDVEEDGADVGKTLAELLPGRGKIGDSRSKFLAEVEDDFWDDPSKFVDLGPGPPDPYDVMVEDRMGGLRSRTRAATTERAATRRGLTSRKADERSISELYGGGSPRQPGSTDGKIWDRLAVDGGMTPERTQAIADAAAALEQDLMSGTGTPGKRLDQSVSLAGTNADKAGTSWEWVMRPAIADLMFGDESRVGDVPPASEWRLGELTGDIDTDIAGIEDILQNQVVQIGAGSENTVAHKRKLLDSLAVLAHMRKSGNYEALEQLHPKHREQLLGKARELDQTIPEKVKAGAAKSSLFGAVGGFDSVEAFKNEMKGRTRTRGGRTPGGKRATRRERVGEETQRLTGAIRGQGGPAAWWRRRQEQARRAAAGRGGRPARARVVKDPWDKDLPREEKKELKKAKKATKKLGRLTPEKRLGRIRDKRSQAAMSQRDVDTPIGGAGATTAFAGTIDDLAQWEAAEGRPVVDASFVERLSFLTKIRRGEENAELNRNKGEGGGRKTTGERRIRDEVLANAWLTAGHSDLPELVDADELAELAFEADPDNPGVFRLREGFKPIQRGMSRQRREGEGETYWEQWTRLIGRFIPGQGMEGHKPGENHAEPPVLVDGVEAAKGNLYGGYGKGALSFVTPETKLIGWHKLAEINDEGDSITQVLRGAGLTDTEAPTSIKNDGDNFSMAVRAALDAAQTRGGGRLKVRNREKDRRPQDPNNPSPSDRTGSGGYISERVSGTHNMGADWRETEFGAMVDQVLDLHDSGDIDDPTRLEEAWSFLVGMSESVGDNDTYLFDTLPIFGYDAVQRHGGVISVSNRAALVTLDHPVSGSEATVIIERLAKQGQLDQARLRELIPDYGSYR